MKLNLGCGGDIQEGFVNIDVNAALKPDKVIDLVSESLLDHFALDSVDYILAKDIIEHFWRRDAINLLKDCYSVMKSGAIIDFKLPDFNGIMARKELSVDEKILCLIGYQKDDANPQWRGHKYQYTQESFCKTLTDVGFKILECKDGGTNMIVKACK